MLAKIMHCGSTHAATSGWQNTRKQALTSRTSASEKTAKTAMPGNAKYTEFITH